MKRLMLGAVVAIAMACAGLAFSAAGGPSFDKETQALVIAPAATAESSAIQGYAPISTNLDTIDKVNVAAEKRSGKPEGRTRGEKKSDTAARSQRSNPLLL